MLLWFGKWVRGTVLDDQGGQRVEDLAGDVALQAADDLGLRQAFVGAALGVGAGAGVVAEAAKNDNVERVVGATVAAAVGPVAVGASAAGGDRCGAAEVREGGFGLDPVKVVAGADEHLAGDLEYRIALVEYLVGDVHYPHAGEFVLEQRWTYNQGVEAERRFRSDAERASNTWPWWSLVKSPQSMEEVLLAYREVLR